MDFFTSLLSFAIDVISVLLFSVPAYVLGIKGPSGFSSKTTAEEVARKYSENIKGKIFIVTGGTTGLGFETARVLAKYGGHVIIAGRTSKRCEDACAAIKGQIPTAKVTPIILDLSSFASVRDFVKKFKALNLPLHCLINNAGIMNVPFSKSVDGYELQFATNVLGHFLLTDLLLDKLKSSAPARIVNLSSLAHYFTYIQRGIKFDQLDNPKGYIRSAAYGQSKLANILHAKELNRRLKSSGALVTANSLHPGSILTELLNPSVPKNFILRSIFRIVTGVLSAFIMKNVAQGAATTVYVATASEIEGIGGEYFDDVNIARMSFHARDSDLARRLYDTCAAIVTEKKGA